jgi:precorrin-8X/cobalt-precorrin-8 methylmutase
VPLFDTYIMVDWSGRSGRLSGREDCIWIAHGPAAAAKPLTVSPPSRTEAEQVIRALLERAVASAGGRALVCADFAYGYPAGFAALLPTSNGRRSASWRTVWRFLRKEVRDDLGTEPGRRPSNRSNRFEVANRINDVAATRGAKGPFWCLYRAGSHPCIPQERPTQPFVHATGAVAERRLTDRIARSDTPFRLFGTGSVGSQALTGIPRLAALRSDPRLSPHSLVWPFETGWAAPTGSWLGPAVRVVHAEIYPSVRAPHDDRIKDRGQVRAMWHWARDLDEQDRLLSQFAIPPDVAAGSRADLTIRTEEGWILGSPRHDAARG